MQRSRHFFAARKVSSVARSLQNGGTYGGGQKVAITIGLGAFVGAAAVVSSLDDQSSTLPSVEFVDGLIAIVGKEGVEVDLEVRAEHGNDKWSHHGGTMPGVVVFPKSVEQVQAIVRLCAMKRVPIIPYGSGTSLEGHTTAPYGGVTLVMTEMASVLRVSDSDMDCTVQPGISYNELNERLAEFGLFFPVDPGPGASIGGMCATGCSGTNAVRFGTMKQNVLSLKVVTPDGEVVTTARRARKSVAGYDLTSLFVGSEGTLGVVVEATLRLQPVPQRSAVAAAAFENVQQACEATRALARDGVQVQCVELLDAAMMRAVNRNSGFSYPEKPHLFFKFSGTEAQVADCGERVAAMAERFGAGGLQWETEAEGQANLWEARKVALWAAAAMRPGCKVWTTDVCVPLSRMAECLDATAADIAASSLDAPIVGHVGDGNFHVFYLLEEGNADELAEAAALNDRMVRRAIEMEGTCTGEHGVGVGKKKYLETELGRENVRLMRQIKRQLDPLNIMNPGKLVPDAPKAGASEESCLRPADVHTGHCCV